MRPYNDWKHEMFVKFSPKCILTVHRTAHAALCLILGGVLDRFPKVKFCLAHGGGAFPFTIGRFNHGYICRPGTNLNLEKEEFLIFHCLKLD